MNRILRSARLASGVLGATFVVEVLGAGCGQPEERVASATSSAESELVAYPHAVDFGVNEWPAELDALATFRAASGTPSSVPRLCHIYTYWDIARHDPAGGDATHTLSGLIQWMGRAETACDEVLVTFQGPQQPSPVAAPSASEFEQAFVRFQALAATGQPLAVWAGKIAYTPWNEPNNLANSGNGLGTHLSPELAADYYLAARKHCDPAAGCKVAAGDFATNGATAADVAWDCVDDNDPADTPTRCAQPSPFNHSGDAPSYLDRYKNHIARSATAYGLSSSFRPEYFAYHPWHDVNAYIDSNAACSSYEDCATRRLLQSLGGTWGDSEIWDTEIGVGLQNATAPDEHTTQPCGAAFLVRLTDLSPRITRLYYMMFVGGRGPLFDGTTLRPAGRILADSATSYGGARCADTGIVMASYSNPILPMFDRPAGAPAGHMATEGCPDPTGIKTRSGEYYLYCTSYTFPYSRYDGFPIFEAGSLAGDSWRWAGSILPDVGPSRSSWPSWIKDRSGHRYGLFWAPDVHELPTGKFAATYAAPCGDTQCVGLAWSDTPTGPWTHQMDEPFVSAANNGPNLGGPGHMTYDPNLLVASDGHLYLYWVVAGAGIYGAEVSAAASGRLSFASAPQKLVAWGAGGEGPYAIERAGTFYLFFSNDPTGGILYDYQVHVRRAASPLGPFDEEGPIVLHKSDDASGGAVRGPSFVATGGNSVIQNAVDGVDYLVYHAIKVPEGSACPGVDPTSGTAVRRDATTNPYCRTQGERQAMLDPITWTPDGSGGEWPSVEGAVPSTGSRRLP